MKTRVLIAAAIAALSMAGCTAQARSPEPVPLDRVDCARCRMLVSTEAGAAEIVSEHDDTRFYDDVGCVAADWPSHASGAIAFVRASGGEWLDARAASFARPAAARTAMGSGFVAYAAAKEARAADREGEALSWDDVVRLAGERR